MNRQDAKIATTEITICHLELTPRCQQVHGGLDNALLEAVRRIMLTCHAAAAHECNAGAHYHLIVKLERKTPGA